MEQTEHLVIEDTNTESFIKRLNDASKEGYTVIASHTNITTANYTGYTHYTTTYYSLLARKV